MIDFFLDDVRAVLVSSDGSLKIDLIDPSPFDANPFGYIVDWEHLPRLEKASLEEAPYVWPDFPAQGIVMFGFDGYSGKVNRVATNLTGEVVEGPVGFCGCEPFPAGLSRDEKIASVVPENVPQAFIEKIVQVWAETFRAYPWPKPKGFVA